MRAHSVAANTIDEIKISTTPSWLLPFYFNLISIVGVMVILYSLAHLPEDLVGLAFFAVFASLAELTTVEPFVNNRPSRVSVSSMLAIAGIVLFGPYAGVLIHMVSGLTTILTTTLFSNLSMKGRVSSLRRDIFNVGMLVTASFIAGWVYRWVDGSFHDLEHAGNLPALIAAATTYAVINLNILIGVLSLQTGRSSDHILNQGFKWATPIAAIAGVLGGGALALVFYLFRFLGLAVFLLPIILTSYSFRVYMTDSSKHVNQLEQLNQELDEANFGLLKTLASVIDAYDIYTYGHSSQVAVYIKDLAKKMGLAKKQIDLLVRAAYIHDIGKVGVAEKIISKQGPLIIEEYNFIKRHPVIGAKIIGQMKGLQDLVPLIKHHHERWDGFGYPDGLHGEEIPLGARILALADSLDSMCSDRPYRSTRNFKEIVEEIQRCSGTQFDPQVVRAFLLQVKEKNWDYFRNSAVTVDKQILLNHNGNEADKVRYMKKSEVTVF